MRGWLSCTCFPSGTNCLRHSVRTPLSGVDLVFIDYSSDAILQNASANRQFSSFQFRVIILCPHFHASPLPFLTLILVLCFISFFSVLASCSDTWQLLDFRPGLEELFGVIFFILYGSFSNISPQMYPLTRVTEKVSVDHEEEKRCILLLCHSFYV